MGLLGVYPNEEGMWGTLGSPLRCTSTESHMTYKCR